MNDSPDEPTITKADVLAMLSDDRDLARATGQASAAVRAAELMGKELGMFVERSVAVTATVEVPDLELAQRIAYLLISAGEQPSVTVPCDTEPLPPEPIGDNTSG